MTRTHRHTYTHKHTDAEETLRLEMHFIVDFEGNSMLFAYFAAEPTIFFEILSIL